MSNRKYPLLEPGFSFGGPLFRTLSDSAKTETSIPAIQAEKNSDKYWMLEALLESQTSIGITNPNPAVGCILVDSHGQEISRGSTQRYLRSHAERVAFEKVTDSNRLQGATAYVTLEPCSHFGKQPPCVDLLVNSPIKRIVIARADSNPIVNGRGIQKLTQAGKKVEIGLLSTETTAWNYSFFAYQKRKRPMVALKWAQTLDGQLADDSNTSQWITGQPARSYTHWLRQRYDAVFVGARTVIADQPRLNVRDCAHPHQAEPIPIVFDPNGILFQTSLDQQENLVKSTFAAGRSVVFLASMNQQKEFASSWIKKLSHVFPFFLKNPSSIPEIMEHLASTEMEKILARPLQSIFVEGGPRTLTSFLDSGYADLLHVFIAPSFTGGNRNRISLNKHLSEKITYTAVSSCQLGADLLMELIPEEHIDIFGA
jgi:diaminohydroxyphosphoribosylaminopyrimidine deaminase/5-amino-6-(5-phosphoribosylamino)uracil reductase